MVKWHKNIGSQTKRRRDTSYLENCCLCESTSFDIVGSPSSFAQSSNFSIHFLSAANLARPASLKFSNSTMLPRNIKMSCEKGYNNNINVALFTFTAEFISEKLLIERMFSTFSHTKSANLPVLLLWHVNCYQWCPASMIPMNISLFPCFMVSFCVKNYIPIIIIIIIIRFCKIQAFVLIFTFLYFYSVNLKIQPHTIKEL